MSAASLHSCGVSTDGQARCWGLDANVVVPSDLSLVQLSSGFFHGCGLDTNGRIQCWGDDSDGRTRPPEGTFTQVSSGTSHSCGVGTDGRLACWGVEDNDRTRPPSGTFTQVDDGRFHSCGLRLNGTVSCWGWNEAGQASPPAGAFTQVSAGGFHSCGVRTDGTVSCWGNDVFGQSRPPAGAFLAVSTGEGHSCGVRTDNTLACWGWNEDGQASPPAGLFSQVIAADFHSCALALDGTVACWGDDFLGQASPPIGAFAQLSGNFLYNCGLRPDQSTECWGYSGHGPITPPGDLVAATDPGALRLDPTRLFNVSTRGAVEGDGLQAGFIVTGSSRRFAVLGEAIDRPLDARLPLTTFPDGQTVDQNDTWQDHPTAPELADILRPPGAATDAAFIATLGPGAYVATLSSQDGLEAPGIVAVTALDEPNDTYPLNLSTQGSGALTAGFIVTGNASRCYVIKAEGVGDGAMDDPALVIRRPNGTIVDANDDWTSHPSAELVTLAGFAPVRDTEAALAVRLSEGVYWAELFSMRQSQAQNRAIIAATEVVDDPTLADCDEPTPFQPTPVDDTVPDPGPAVLTLELVAPAARCITQNAMGCGAYQARRNVALRETVELIVQARSSGVDDALNYDWQFEGAALVEELAPNRLQVRFQNTGNQDVTVTVNSPAAGSLSTALRLRVLDPDAGGGR
ncbi:MAG: RCC1 domain-containing protein [Candidatus Competibacterales bacterium]